MIGEDVRKGNKFRLGDNNMFRINHNDAIELEHQVRRLYGCDRGGVSGMADADYFEGHPIQAAVLVVSYIHANHRESGPYQFDEFLNKYETIFECPAAHSGRRKPHAIFSRFAYPIVPCRDLPHFSPGMAARCRSLV